MPCDQLSPHYPEQFRDIAYGPYGEEEVYGYLGRPTPGEANNESEAWAAVVSSVNFSKERGFYEGPFTVELSTETPKAVIRYTTDGSEPTASNALTYTEPIVIDKTTLLRAIALKPDYFPSYVDTHTYIFLDHVLNQPANPPGFPTTWGTMPEGVKEVPEGSPMTADYEIDPEVVKDPRYSHTIEDDLKSIPTLSIVTTPRHFDELYSNPRKRGITWERPTSVELIYPESELEGFQINAGIRIQGKVGRLEFMPKHSFRLFFRGKYGATKLEYALFRDSTVERFDTLVLRGGVNESYSGDPYKKGHKWSTYTRDEWLRRSQIAMSGIGSHGIFVHLYLNGLYWGIYNIVERPDDSFMSSYFGGKKEDWYVKNHNGPVTEANDRVEALIYGLINRGRFEEPNHYADLKEFVDLDQFIDYVILNWYAGNEDWADNNWYASFRNPSGRINYFVWDGERTWKEGARIYFGKLKWQNRNVVEPLFDLLIHNPDFKIKLADRLYKHLFNDGVLTDANSQARWLSINDEIDRAIVGESARWGDTRHQTPITRDDWIEARDAILAQMEGNGAKLIALAREVGFYPDLDPPLFNQHGGLITPDFKLIMTPQPSPLLAKEMEGSRIYYTTDGSDPRLPVTGDIASGAEQYSTPLTLTTNTHIKMRTLQNHTWSALNEATFRVVKRDAQLRLTEIMYNPIGSDDYEFIKLTNTGTDAIDLSGMSFTGIRFAFLASTPPLDSGASIFLVRNQKAFAERYPNVSIAGRYEGQLSNKGEEITLYDARDNVVISITYDDENGWPISPDGRGDSLVLVDWDGDPNNPKSWRASVNLYGSPGIDESDHQN